MPFLLTLILLGVIQGLTEFLPVSSSGHLSLFQYFSHNLHDNLSLNIAVHLGTLLTVVLYYRHDLIQMAQGFFKGQAQAVRMVLLIGVASFPTAVLGLFIKKMGGWLLTNPVVAAFGLLVTGGILFLTERIQVKQQSTQGFGLSYKQAFCIGLVQGFAVLPGISRSGSTIVMGLFLGMSSANAARFSFLISLPAILGAGLLEFKDLDQGVEWSPFLIGGVVSFVTGLFAITWMVRLTEKGRLKPFGYYVTCLALVFLAAYSMGWGQNII